MVLRLLTTATATAPSDKSTPAAPISAMVLTGTEELESDGAFSVFTVVVRVVVDVLLVVKVSVTVGLKTVNVLEVAV